MSFTLAETQYEPLLEWTKNDNGSRTATGKNHSYCLCQLTQGDKKWIADIDGKRELQTHPDAVGETLQFWYREDAERHCHEREYGRKGHDRSTHGPRPR